MTQYRYILKLKVLFVPVWFNILNVAHKNHEKYLPITQKLIKSCNIQMA